LGFGLAALLVVDHVEPEGGHLVRVRLRVRVRVRVRVKVRG